MIIPQLAALFHLLKGDPDLTSPRKLTPEAKATLEIVEQALTNRQVYRVCLETCITVFIFTVEFHPTAITGQWDTQWSDPLHALEWIFLPHQPKKATPTIFELIAQLIMKCCQRCLQLTAKDPSKIIIPVTQEEFEWCYANSTALQSALQNFSGQISYHLPSHTLLQMSQTTAISLKLLNSRTPSKGITVLTDGSGKTGKAIVTRKEDSEWQTLEGHENGSPQLSYVL